MKLAIMQPYIFPYIGYYQLLAAADKFVVYDDVNFIKGGWINRNRILVNGLPQLFTVPLDAPSPNKKIRDVFLNKNTKWRAKLLQTIAQAYRRAPYFNLAYDLVERVLLAPDAQTIADLVRVSLHEIVHYLEINVDVVSSSTHYENDNLSGQSRVLDICRLEGATEYINAQGGRVLYDHEVFRRHSLKLLFLQPQLQPYRQLGKQAFVPGLSVIDLLMNNSVNEAQAQLQTHSLAK